MAKEKKDLKLVFVNPIGKNSEGLFEYDFFFSNRIELVWGDNWDEPYALYGGDMKPRDGTYQEVRRIVTNIPLFCAQQNTCFSMKHCVQGCIALCYEDINDYKDYPEPYRIVFQYGEYIESVMEKLYSRNSE